VAIWQHYKRVLGIFSLRMRRNGYIGASGQKMTPSFAPVTSISYKTDEFPLPSDVYRIYSTFFATALHDHVTLTFDLLTLSVSDELSFTHPTHISIFSILRLSVPELWVTQSDHITFTWNGHYACAVSLDLSPGSKIVHIFEIPDPNLPIHFVTSGRYDEE